MLHYFQQMGPEYSPDGIFTCLKLSPTVTK